MTDGTEITVVIFIPIQGEGNSQFPVIFLYTPYRRANIDHETGKIEDFSSDSDMRFLLSHGYHWLSRICAVPVLPQAGSWTLCRKSGGTEKNW